MGNLIRVILSLLLVSLFAVNSVAQSVEDYPETIVLDDVVYTRVIVDDEVYYTSEDEYFIYDLELGEMMEAEISFP